jgi:TonB family protein
MDAGTICTGALSIRPILYYCHTILRVQTNEDDLFIMGQTLKQWEGKIVDGKFPLLELLGSSDHSIVFRTEHERGDLRKAAIKLAAEVAECSEAKLQLWQQAAGLPSSHLLKIFEAGRCQIDGEPLTYVVMEYADENLSEITSQRRLSFDEAIELLPPLLNGLADLHGKNFAHGNLKPSNVLAVGDQVKVSCDTLRAIGTIAKGDTCFHPSSIYAAPEVATGPISSAADVWSLGVILKEALPLAGSDNASAIEPAPREESFSEIIDGCLQPDPQQRWSIADVTKRLNSFTTPHGPSDGDAKETLPASGALTRNLFIALTGLAVLFLAVWLFKFKAPSSKVTPPITAPAPESVPLPVQPNPATTDSASTAPPAPPEPPSKHRLSPATAQKAAPGSVVQRVTPNVSRSARRTIQGHIRVGVKVDVDASGKVTNATLISPGPSEYFARLALGAARNWKFSSAQVNGNSVPSQWSLQFSFGRRKTDVRPTRIAP